MVDIPLAQRESVFEVEEGTALAPKFDENGLIPVVTTDSKSGEVLMHGYMNKEAFELSLSTKQAHYWSRSRNCIWKKGKTSGLTQQITEIMIDDDQDCVIFYVNLGGLKASCHVGYKSCFYRKISLKNGVFNDDLEFVENKKVFEPKKIYGDTPNPTKL